MKKELFFICAAAVLGTFCFSNLTADKCAADISGDYRYVITGRKQKTCAVRKYLGKDKDVVVPEKIDGYTVTRIGNRAFKNNTVIQSVKLSKSITTIGESSFYGCSGLKSVSLPSKLHTLRKKAFCYCDSLKSISLPAGLKKIRKEAFYGCPFDEICIPQHVDSIGLDAFAPDIGKVSVDPKNRTFDSRDNSNAVIETASDTLIFAGKDPVIPASVKRIEEFAFWNHDEISSIDIPDSVEDIGDGAFSDCNRLKEIAVPSSVKTIGENAFFGCDKLGKVSFSEGLISMGKYVFEGCDSLKEIRLPDSLETIGEGAFFCNNLDSIYIPENLKKTDLNKIFDCSSATKISVAEGNPYYDSRGNCNAIVETSTNTLIRASKTTVIPDSVTAIGNDAFSNIHELKEITVPSNVKTIGKYAFWSCELLEKIDLPESLVSIGEDTFYGCSLKTVNYRGNKAQWKKIRIEDKDSLSDVKINYNYKG